MSSRDENIDYAIIEMTSEFEAKRLQKNLGIKHPLLAKNEFKLDGEIYEEKGLVKKTAQKY